MSEIKHTFQAGKMNKDLDERLVPQGEYRDALNIEVRTSGDSDAGTAQMLYGNLERVGSSISLTTNWMSQPSVFVGSVADEKVNKSYYFVASPPVGEITLTGTDDKVFKDMIVQYDTDTRTIKPVVNDIFELHLYDVGATGVDGSTAYSAVTLSDASQVRVGMEATALTAVGVSLLSSSNDYSNLPPNPVVKKVVGNTVTFDRELDGTLASVTKWIFKAPRVLNFNRSKANTKKLITGINVIDNLLFWTDDFSEPKKINIDRCIAGTPDFTTHTKLMVTNPNSSIDALTSNGYLKEEHITVIRRAPRTSPKLEMSSSKRGGDVSGTCTQTFTYATDVTVTDASGTTTMVEAGDPFQAMHVVMGVEIVGVNYNEGDFLTLTNDTIIGEPVSIRAKVIAEDPTLDTYDLEIQSIDTNITSSHTAWDLELEQIKPLFELDLGRFSYRYKYQDGEYSSFAPWSEIAFLPGEFDYAPIKGYNLGMVNTVRDLKVTDFIVEDQLRPDDTVAVDVLYKDTVSPNVYIVKTITRGIDSEWDETGAGGNSGVLNITSDMIHMALPSSQILRAWDNVPRLAKAQEVTGNRLLYANYLQNYNVRQPVTIKQQLVVKDHAEGLLPEKSIKSIRKYKLGVVFGDKYGRETTVLGMGGTRKTSGKEVVLDSNVSVEKLNAHRVSKLSAQQDWVTDTASWVPSDWMEYYKYYVKETTNEYYNLAMDRWYDAEDGNTWLSFQSADRNKLDESTYIILKNGHGNQEPVLEEARYKILAIENEAPDYIKTTQKIIGDLPLTSGSNPDGADLVSSMTVNFGEGAWNQMFNEVKFKGIGYARIKGVTDAGVVTYSKWVKISRMNDATFSVNTIEQFGESANMGTTNYSLEIKDDVVENRPEFDGRFFVKIFKDGTLARNVLLETEDDLNYATVDSFQYMYLNNLSDPGGGTHISTSGTHASYDWENSDVAAADANHLGEAAFRSETIDFWQGWGANGPATGSNGWFLDQSKVRRNHKAFKNMEGLHSSETLPGVTGRNAMVFSIRKDHYGSSGAQQDFKTKMTTQGNFFKFKADPNGVVYEVKSSEDATVEQSNYTKAPDGNGNRYTGSNNSGQRRSFYVYFTQANDSSKGVIISDWDPRGEIKHDGKSTSGIDIVEAQYTYEQDLRFVEGNAIWETEPKEDVGLELYYEATDALPMYLKHENCESFAPKLSEVTCEREGEGTTFIANAPIVNSIVRDVVGIRDATSVAVYPFKVIIGDKLRFKHANGLVTESKVLDHWSALTSEDGVYKPSKSFTISTVFDADNTATVAVTTGFNTSGGTVWEVSSETVTIPNATFVTNITDTAVTLNNTIGVSATHNCTFREVTGYYKLDNDLYKYKSDLPWFNCYSFGNGLESDRIRDDYNAPTIDNGVKVSTTLENYGEERRGSGLIYSGIYNSTSGVNNLNEFNMAEAITKDLNPSYGSIQALKGRDTNVVTFCEDKVLQILANKDALFNSDGSKNLTASSNVLGDASAFAGDYGISLNPESLAVDGYRMYFTDKQRNKVLRLSQNGLTPISDVGMTTWFRDNLKPTHELVGTFDEIKGEYNLSLRHEPDWIDYKTGHESGGNTITSSYTDTTVSFNEKSKGWSSFKSFVPQVGLSINDEYITGVNGKLWSHHDEGTAANKFYGVQYYSTIDVLFNDMPSSVKSFASMNYEGSQAKVTKYAVSGDYTTAEYHNLAEKAGWYVTSFNTDLQDGDVKEFKEKEGKWFNYITGVATTLDNLDTSEFSVQGLGTATISVTTEASEFTLTIQNGD
jgi:hypothetical protein